MVKKFTMDVHHTHQLRITNMYVVKLDMKKLNYHQLWYHHLILLLLKVTLPVVGHQTKFIKFDILGLEVGSARG